MSYYETNTEAVRQSDITLGDVSDIKRGPKGRLQVDASDFGMKPDVWPEFLRVLKFGTCETMSLRKKRRLFTKGKLMGCYYQANRGLRILILNK